MLRWSLMTFLAILVGSVACGTGAKADLPQTMLIRPGKNVPMDVKKSSWILERNLTGIGVPRRDCSADDVNAAALENVSLVVMAKSLKLPPNAEAAVKAFEARGGKMLRFRRWEFKTPDQFFDRVAKEAPALAPAFEPVRRANAARREAELKTLASLPGKKGERRRMSFHDTAWRPVVKGEEWTWDRTIAFLRSAGFTMATACSVYPNLARFPSKALPVSTRLVAGSPAPLDEFVAACKSNGVQSCVCLRCFTTHHFKTKREYEATEPSWERWIAEDPSILAHDKKGGVAPGGALCPSHPETRRRLVEVARELCAHGVDVIALDFIRFHTVDVCFCERCKKGIAAKGGDVIAFRKETIHSFVREIRTVMKREYPSVELHASVLENARTYAGRIGQDWEAWCREGLLDVVSPMDYTYFPGEYVKQIEMQREQCHGVSMMPVFGPTLWPDDGHLEMRAVESLRETRETGMPGFGWFCFDDRTVRLIEALKKGPLKCEN